ncbi:MAG: D-amino-acid transaminase [Hyphomicrobiaceae bacterium]
MSRIVYVNGQYLPYSRAAVHVEDRGFQFADAVYEVIEVRNRCLVDATQHLKRLTRSLSQLQMPHPMSERALRHVIHETVRRNRVGNGQVYLQITRGAAPRDFFFPKSEETPPTLVCLARSLSPEMQAAKAQRGIAVTTAPDIRWQRCDIKTVMLLPACLAKSGAREAGAQEAWFVDSQGFITEGASSNAWIILDDNTLVTRQLSNKILPGITRATTTRVLKALNLRLHERPFTPDEVKSAKEAFVTSASAQVMPVVKIDGQPIATGIPGELTLKLRAAFYSEAETSVL